MTDEAWPPAGLDLDELMRASREAARGIRPVLEQIEGSKRLTQTGTCFLLRFDANQAAMITALHTVSGAETKVVALGADSATRWPTSYLTLAGVRPDIPDGDVAYAFGELQPDVVATLGAIPFERTAAYHDFHAGDSFMAIGYPASKAERGGLRILDSRDRWKSALHEAILSPTRRLFPDATTPTEPLANIQGQGGFGCA